MNKYKEALDRIVRSVLHQKVSRWDLEKLEEAIDKANKYDEKETPKKVLAEDIGYNHNNENVFALKCPSCENVLIVADENEINVEDPNSEDILKAFNEEYDFVSDEFTVKYCSDCGEKLRYE